MNRYKLKLCLRYYLPHKWVHSSIYAKRHGETMNWKNPQLYDEKIHWLIVNKYNDEYARFADKYEVREYVKQCGLEKLLIPMYGIYNSSKEIDYGKLPDKFVLKATHGSGEEFYQICTDKASLDINAVNRKLDKSLKEKYCTYGCEYHYRKIRPRIICEELLENGCSERMDDYKVVCSCGKAEAILVCTNRDEGRDYYSTEWEYLDYVKKEYRSKVKIEKPELLDEMVKAAEILSQPFPLSRIDFYVVNNKLYFGEITLTPGAGCHANLNELGQQKLGEAIHL